MYNILAIISSIIIPIIVIIKPIKKILKKKNLIHIIKEYKYEFAIYIFIVIGCLIRSIGINTYPRGLNVDEASSGYDAFSILNYGIDRNGNSFPVFLEAWGSGQNALYTYIMIPFVKLLGLNIISTRLPMVLLGCISLFVWYKLLNKIENKKFALIGVAFLAICPWHIMKSRWGLESNIFPDLVLYAVFFIVKFLENKKYRYFYLAFAFLGLAAYAYGTSYFFLPLFVVPVLICLKYKKLINTSNIFIGFAIIGVISLPIILYLFINTFDFQEIKLFRIFTVPKLPVNRYEEQTSLFSGNLLINLIDNFKNSVKFLLTQNDSRAWNNICGFGMYYIFSSPFAIIGLILNFKKGNKYNYIFNIWFIASFLLLFVLNDVNINRINILIIPIIYYIVIGIYALTKNRNILLFILAIVYLSHFILFGAYYFKSNTKIPYVFVKNVKEVIEYVDGLETEKIYFEYSFKEPYIYVLYYTNYNTNEFIKTFEYIDKENLGKFDNIQSFGKYNFYIPKNINSTKENNVIYVIKKENDYNIDYNNYIVKEFKQFFVLEGK